MVEVSFKYTWRAQPEGVVVVEERSSLTDRIVETRINTRDRAIVRALEVMGWASPDRHTQLVEALELAQGFLRNKGHSEEDPFLLSAINAALAPYREGEE